MLTACLMGVLVLVVESGRAVAGEALPNYGVDASKLGKGEAYRFNGKEITSAGARELLERGAVPEDAEALRLTIIGSGEQRRVVREDLRTAEALVPWRGRLCVQDYEPGHWAVRSGFHTAGEPTIYVQRPDGVVLHRQDDYGGAEELAAALRRADPRYDPQRDPDLRQRIVGPWRRWREIPMAAWFLVAGIVVLFIRRGKP